MTGAGIDNARNKECSAAAMTQKAPTCTAHDHDRKQVNTSPAHGVQGGGQSRNHLGEVA